MKDCYLTMFPWAQPVGKDSFSLTAFAVTKNSAVREKGLQRMLSDIDNRAEVAGGKWMSQLVDFVKLEFDEGTNERLLDYCKAHRLGHADRDDQSALSAADFGFHVTVMYSKETNPAFPVGEFDVGPYRLRPEAFDMFGPDREILVLKLRRDKPLTELFDHYRNAYGHVSDFMPYLPHVSIHGSGAEVKDRLSRIPLPDFELCANKLIQKVKVVRAA